MPKHAAEAEKETIMHGKTHDLTSLLLEMAQITGQTFIVLQCENAGGSGRLTQAFPALGDTEIDTLSEGPLIIAYHSDDQARDSCNMLIAQAAQGYEDTGSLVTSTVTFIGRANEGECSRTGILKLVAEIDAGTGPDDRFRFTGTGHLVPPRAGFRVAA